jgi:hypothetical protein
MGILTSQYCEQVKERIGYLPDNSDYKVMGIEEGETAQTTEIIQLSEPDFTVHICGKIILGKMHISLIKPISVRLFSDGDFFFAQNENLNICGIGKSLQNALKDFRQHLSYFTQYYMSSNESEFVGEGLRLKKIYDNLFEK